MNNNNHTTVALPMNQTRSLNRFARSTIPLAITAAFFAGSAVADQMSDRLQALEAEMAALKTEIKTKEEEQYKKGVKTKKNVSVQFGGFIKADAMFSDYSDGVPSNALIDDFLVPSLIPSGGDGNGQEFDAHAKHSRVYLKATSDTDAGEIMGYIEMDFNSSADERLTNQASGGLRHAYVKWSYSDTASILAGQTWSTLFNVGALPETVDFIGPTSGTLFIRQEQVRWTKKISGAGAIMLAAENPSTGLFDGGAGINSNSYDNNSMPDLVARYDGKTGSLSYAAALIAREITYDTGAMDDSTVGTGISLSGVYKFANGDDIKAMFSYGALGRYIALQAFRDGVIEADGGIETTDVTGGYIAYRHLWNEQWRSTLSYAMATADNPDTIVGDQIETVSNTNINLMYSPTKALTFGAEYILADKELESGVKGDMSRLQFMGKWAF